MLYGSTLTPAHSTYRPVGDDAFDKLSKHWSPSSSEVSTCVVEPKTASDVGRILKIVGLSRTPFAVSRSITVEWMTAKPCIFLGSLWWPLHQPWLLVDEGYSHLPK